MKLNNWQRAKKILKESGVIVAPTDTLYGILARAEDKKAVKKVYEVKGRDEDKPFIVLITSLNDLKKFGVIINSDQKEFFQKVWPGKVSIILPCLEKKYKYLHRGTNAIAFRMISKKNRNLYNLIKTIGPLVAPSANIQGQKPAENINEAKDYFGNNIDLYINNGIRKSKPSTLVSLINSKIEILRQGTVKIKTSR